MDSKQTEVGVLVSGKAFKDLEALRDDAAKNLKNGLTDQQIVAASLAFFKAMGMDEQPKDAALLVAAVAAFNAR